MANAIKKISVARGYDVTRYTLQCFGGAGGQHACLVADALGMSRVFVHPLAGVLSAYGMGLADQNTIREQAIELPLAPESLPQVTERLDALGNAAQAELRRQQAGDGDIVAASPRPRSLRGQRFGARGAVRRPGHHRCRFRGGLPPALCLPDARQADDGGSGFGGGGGAGRGRGRAAPCHEPGARGAAPRNRPHVFGRAMAPGGAGGARGPATRRSGLRTRHHRRAQCHHRRRARVGGEHHRPRPHRAGPPGGAQREVCGRHDRRPGAAGGLQQPLHEHRRADGPAAAEHGLLGQHQGAPGFFLRAVRRARPSDRQCAAHAGAPGIDGREHQDRDPRKRRSHGAGRRVCAERSLSRRHPSAGRDGDHPRVPADTLPRDGGGRGWG